MGILNGREIEDCINFQGVAELQHRQDLRDFIAELECGCNCDECIQRLIESLKQLVED